FAKARRFGVARLGASPGEIHLVFRHAATRAFVINRMSEDLVQHVAVLGPARIDARHRDTKARGIFARHTGFRSGLGLVSGTADHRGQEPVWRVELHAHTWNWDAGAG